MNPNRPAIEWTPERLRLLRDHYPTMFNNALARWIGCSTRTLERKAAEMGIRKVADFNTVRAYDISKLLSESVKRAYDDGRLVSQFPKGVRSNPGGEFKPGFKFTGEIEQARIEKIRTTYRRKKMLSRYGL